MLLTPSSNSLRSRTRTTVLVVPSCQAWILFIVLVTLTDMGPDDNTTACTILGRTLSNVVVGIMCR